MHCHGSVHSPCTCPAPFAVHLLLHHSTGPEPEQQRDFSVCLKMQLAYLQNLTNK